MSENPYAVLILTDFDYLVTERVVLFDDFDKARAYLHWAWEDYYNTELAEAGPYPVCALVESECYHKDDYAIISWMNGDKAEFLLERASDPEKEFEQINWKRYL